MKKKERNNEILKMRKEGKTLEYIGSFFNVSRQRAWEILKENEKPLTKKQ